MTNEEAASAISAVLEQLEQSANDGHDAVSDLAEAWAQMATNDGVSTLETIAMKSELETIISDFRAKVYGFHSRGYQRAVATGIDGLFPQPRGGTR
jgi:hypothetical protein